MKTNATLAHVEQAVSEIRAKYDMGGRPMSEADFYRICKGERITLANDHDDFRRLGVTLNGQLRGFALPSVKCIWLACFFEEFFEHFTAGHELGHVLLGHRNTSKVTTKGITYELSLDDIKYRNSQNEIEADYFAELLNKVGI